MAGFLTRLGRGVGAFMEGTGEAFYNNKLEQDRADRLAKLKKEDREFTAGENEKDRNARMKLAGMRGSGSDSKEKDYEKIAELTGPMGEKDGRLLVRRRTSEGYKEFIFDPADNSYTPAGEGVAPTAEEVTNVIPDDILETSKKYANLFTTASLDPRKGWDSQDLEALPVAEDRSEDRVAEMHSQIIMAARNSGGKAAEKRAIAYLSEGTKEEQLKKLSKRYYQLTGQDEKSRVTQPKTKAEDKPETSEDSGSPFADIKSTTSGLLSKLKTGIKKDLERSGAVAQENQKVVDEWNSIKNTLSFEQKQAWKRENLGRIKGDAKQSYLKMIVD